MYLTALGLDALVTATIALARVASDGPICALAIALVTIGENKCAPAH